MIIVHFEESHPGHAGRPGQVGGSAPGNAPPPPPGASKAYAKLKPKEPIDPTPMDEEQAKGMVKYLDRVGKNWEKAVGKGNIRKPGKGEEEIYNRINADEDLASLKKKYAALRQKSNELRSKHHEFSKSTPIGNGNAKVIHQGKWSEEKYQKASAALSRLSTMYAQRIQELEKQF